MTFCRLEQNCRQALLVTGRAINSGCVRSVARRLALGYSDELLFGRRFHNPTSRFPPSPTPVVILNRFQAGQGHCSIHRKKLGLTDNEMCDCGQHTDDVIHRQQLLSNLDSSLRRRQIVDEEAAVDWLMSYGTETYI